MDVMPTRMVKAGEIVFYEGDAPDSGLYYICYGTVEVLRREESGERLLGTLSDGAVFGEMALINSKPRNATIRARTDCGFYTINQANFQHKVEQLDPVMRGVFRVFVLTIRDFLQQHDDHASARRKQQEDGVQYEVTRGTTIGGTPAATPRDRKLDF